MECRGGARVGSHQNVVGLADGSDTPELEEGLFGIELDLGKLAAGLGAEGAEVGLQALEELLVPTAWWRCHHKSSQQPGTLHSAQRRSEHKARKETNES